MERSHTKGEERREEDQRRRWVTSFSYGMAMVTGPDERGRGRGKVHGWVNGDGIGWGFCEPGPPNSYDEGLAKEKIDILEEIPVLTRSKWPVSYRTVSYRLPCFSLLAKRRDRPRCQTKGRAAASRRYNTRSRRLSRTVSYVAGARRDGDQERLHGCRRSVRRGYINKT